MNGKAERPEEAQVERGIVRREATGGLAVGQDLLEDGLGSPGGPGGASTPKRPLLGMVGRFKWTVVLVFMLLVAPAIAVVWLFVIPKYEARAVVRVRPVMPRLVFPTEETGGAIPLYQSYLNSQVGIIRSSAVLEAALDNAEVRRTTWYADPPISAVGSIHDLVRRIVKPPQRLARLLEDLGVAPRPQTELIDLVMKAPTAAEAKVIVDAVLDEYLKLVGEIAYARGDDVTKELEAEHDSLKKEIDSRRKAVTELSKKIGTSTPDELVSQMRLRLDQTDGQLGDTETKMKIAEWTVTQLLGPAALAHGSTTQPTAQDGPAPPYEVDEEWGRLRERARMARFQLDLRLKECHETHPSIARLREQAELAEAQLRAREEELTKQWRDRPALGPTSTAGRQDGRRSPPEVQFDLAMLGQEKEILSQQRMKQRADWETKFDEAQALAKEQEALRQKQALYEAVRTRLEQKRIEQKAPGSIEVLQRGVALDSPARDRRVLFTLMAVFGALGAGVAVAFLRAGRSQDIVQVEDLPPTARVPFLGQLPVVRVRGRGGLPAEEYPAFWEGIRKVRTALLSRIKGKQGSAILVTSAGTATGKTTVSAVLARSMARYGAKVLLVDADLRKPNLNRHFELDMGPGLAEVLSGQASEDQVIIQTSVPGLSMLPAGKTTGGFDLELAANGAFSECIAKWRTRYDMILLDGGPVLPVADARILSQHADGSIMIVREGRCSRPEVIGAVESLIASGGKLLGTVLISSKAESGYGYYHYPNGRSDA